MRVSPTPAHSFALRVAFPVLGGAIAVCAVVAGLLYWSSHEADRVAVERQERLASLVISQLRAAIAHAQESVTVWDDAVEGARGEREPEWIGYNLGEWMHTYFGHDGAYVLDPSDKPTYQFSSDAEPGQDSFAELKGTVSPLLDSVREKMRTGDTEGLSDRILSPGAADIVVVRGHPAVISVKPIISDSGEIEQVPGEEYLHVAVRYLDGDFVAELRRDYLLEDMRFSWSGEVEDGEASLPLTASSGEAVGHLVWRPYRPGSAVLSRVVPMLSFIFALALATIAALLFVLNQRSRKLVASEARMEYLAMHDPLTGLPNRAMLENRLDKDLKGLGANNEMLAVLYLDLDRFKQVNDTLGHPAGDLLIKEFGVRLRMLTRDVDTVARVGGDEFVVVLPKLRQLRDAEGLCDRIIDSVRQPFEIDGNQVFVGVTIGVAVAPGDGDERTELTRKADIALYHAKSAGRSRYAIFGKAMDATLQVRRDIERDLRQALAGNGNEISIHYQPLYGASNMRITGVEALLRWTHPTKGAISPAVFIPIAEETGLIEALGERVLREVCSAASEWPGLTLAVNVSAIELRNPAFAARVAEILLASGVPPQRLELEVTESALTDNAGHCEQNVRALREMGVRIALDDFGTGFSSLGRLQQLEVDRIKIDQSFVHGFGRASGDEAIVQAIVDLAHAKGLKTTAEGVETSEQGDYLKGIGCDELQGFLFSRAIPRDELDRLLGIKARRSDWVASAA